MVRGEDHDDPGYVVDRREQRRSPAISSLLMTATSGCGREFSDTCQRRSPRRPLRSAAVNRPVRPPRATEARIPTDKLVRYALDPAHERGQHKARVFESALGITARDWR
jgi:hypothetical protein